MSTLIVYSRSWPWLPGSVKPPLQRPPLPDHGNKIPIVPLCELEKGTPPWVGQLHARAHSLGGLHGLDGPLGWVTCATVFSSPDYRPHGVGGLVTPRRGSSKVVLLRNMIIPWPVDLILLSRTYGVPNVCLPCGGIHVFSSWRLGVRGTRCSLSLGLCFPVLQLFTAPPPAALHLACPCCGSQSPAGLPLSLLSPKTATHPLSVPQSSSPPRDLCTGCPFHLEDVPSPACSLHVNINLSSLWP